jgi:hypothetical protein
MNYLPIYLLLIFIILFFSYYNSLNYEKEKENFTPHIRRFYRPHLRNARIFTENFYNNWKGYFHRSLRKSGWIK